MAMFRCIMCGCNSLVFTFTGSKNREFNFRHDWNSLISDDPTLFLKHYTDEYFPVADVYVI